MDFLDENIGYGTFGNYSGWNDVNGQIFKWNYDPKTTSIDESFSPENVIAFHT